MRIVNTESGEVSEAITGIPAVDSRAQGGLLGLTIDPDFASNRMVYWAFTEQVKEGNHTAIAKGELSEDEKTIQNVKVIYRASPSYDGIRHRSEERRVGKEGGCWASA